MFPSSTSRRQIKPWTLNAYAGRYRNESEKLNVVISIPDRALRLRMFNADEDVFAIQPCDIISSTFAKDQFELGNIWPWIGEMNEAKERMPVKPMRFFQDNGMTVGFSTKIDGKKDCVCFDKADSSRNFFQLPAEIRNRIYHYTFGGEHEEITLTKDADKLVYCLPSDEDTEKVVQANKLQYTCRQIFQETRGLEIATKPLRPRDEDFRAHITMLEPKGLLIKRMLHVVIRGLNGMFTHGTAYSKQHPLIGFSKAYPHVLVEVFPDDWHYRGHQNAILFLRRGWILQRKIRGSRSGQPFPRDQNIVQDIMAYETTSRLNAPGMKIRPQEGEDYDEMAFKDHLREELKNPAEPRAATILRTVSSVDQLHQMAAIWHLTGI